MGFLESRDTFLGRPKMNLGVYIHSDFLFWETLKCFWVWGEGLAVHCTLWDVNPLSKIMCYRVRQSL